MKKSILLVLCLNTLLAMGQERTNCLDEDPSPGYYLTIQSYEKDTIDGLIDIKVILTADDTVFIGNLFQLSFENFLTGSQIFYNNRDSLLPGDTMNFSIISTFDTANLPYYPVSIEMFFKDSVLNSHCIYSKTIPFKMFFTPWNTMEVLPNVGVFHQHLKSKQKIT